jgi:hypothetical protein
MKVKTILPEVTLLYDARTPRLENAVGVGDFWYEPEVWTLPLPRREGSLRRPLLLFGSWPG